MKYSFNTWMFSSAINWLPAYPLKETIERLARIGYDAVELGCAAPHAWPYYLDAPKRRDILSWAKDNNVKFSTLLPPSGGGYGLNAASAIREEREFTVKLCQDICDLAVELECTKLLFVAGWYIFGTSKREAWKYSLDTLTKVASYANERGVSVVIEPTACDSNLIECVEDAIMLKEDCGLPNLELMFDTAHAFYRNEPPSDYVYRLGKELTHVHVTDYNRLAPGQGGYDFREVMQALKDVGFDGYVTMECGFAGRGVTVESVARQALEHLKAVEKTLV